MKDPITFPELGSANLSLYADHSSGLSPEARQQRFGHSATSSQFRPLSGEERETFRKWRSGALAFYGIVVSATLFSIVIGPPRRMAIKSNPAYSAIASGGQNQSH